MELKGTLTVLSKIRLKIDPPGDGAWNMALDQVMLEHANQTGEATLRIYRWSTATLSLGLFSEIGRSRMAHGKSRMPGGSPFLWRRRDRPPSRIDL